MKPEKGKIIMKTRTIKGWPDEDEEEPETTKQSKMKPEKTVHHYKPAPTTTEEPIIIDKTYEGVYRRAEISILKQYAFGNLKRLSKFMFSKTLDEFTGSDQDLETRLRAELITNLIGPFINDETRLKQIIDKGDLPLHMITNLKSLAITILEKYKLKALNEDHAQAIEIIKKYLSGTDAYSMLKPLFHKQELKKITQGLFEYNREKHEENPIKYLIKFNFLTKVNTQDYYALNPVKTDNKIIGLIERIQSTLIKPKETDYTKIINQKLKD